MLALDPVLRRLDSNGGVAAIGVRPDRFGEFLVHGRVVGIARAVFAVACCLLGTVSLATGFILDTVNRRARELYVLLADYLIEGRRRSE